MTIRRGFESVKHGALLGIIIFSLILIRSFAAFYTGQISSVTIRSYGRIIYPNSSEPNYNPEPSPPTPLWYEALDICAKMAAIISCVITASKRARKHNGNKVLMFISQKSTKNTKWQ